MAIKAKRGDCLAVVTTTTDFYIGQPNVTRERVEVGQVTSCTRDGYVKAVLDCRGYPLRGWEFGRVLMIPPSEVPAEDVLRVAREHYWPGHEGGLPMPFESLAELRDALRPFRVAVIA